MNRCPECLHQQMHLERVKGSKFGCLGGLTTGQRLRQRRYDAFRLQNLWAGGFKITGSVGSVGEGRTTRIGARVLVAKQQHLRLGGVYKT
jgi:hypothetical protein